MVNLETLTLDQRDKLNSFMEITLTTETDLAYHLLQNSNWDVERAIGTYFNEGFRDVPIGDESQLEEAYSVNNRNEEIPDGDELGNNEIQDIPMAGLGEPIGAVERVESLMSSEPQTVPQKLEQFVENFEARYSGITIPNFYTDTLENAIDIAFNHENENFRRPLVFFINNEYSDMTENFVRSLLCNQFVIELLRDKFILFPWDVTEDSNMIQFLQILTEANMNKVQSDLQDFLFSERANFPLLLIVYKKRYTFETIAKFDGRSDLNDVVNGLHEAYEEYKNEQLIEISRNMQQQRDRQIFDEQNSAYEESLVADMERIESERSLKELEAEEKRKEEIAKQKAEEEVARRVDFYSKQLADEPEESNPECITIRFRMPGGMTTTRRFLNSEKIQSMIDFLGSKGLFPDICNYFNSDHPRKDIQKTFNANSTFAAAHWPNRETVVVERCD